MKKDAAIAVIAAFCALSALAGSQFIAHEKAVSTAPVSTTVEWDAATVDVGALPTGTYSVDGGEVVVLGAVIRLGANGPYLHTNSSHANVGIESVGYNGEGHLMVYTDVPPGAQIISASAEEDETLSMLGIQCGVSGGIHESRVECWRNGNRVHARSSVYGNYSNVWFTQVMFVPDGS